MRAKIGLAAFGLTMIGLFVLQIIAERPIDYDPGHQKAFLRGQTYIANLHRISVR